VKRPAWSSSARAWAWIGGGVAIAIALAAFDPYLFTGGDNVRYYALAKALATGHGYVDLITPGAPVETVYPPGFALLLVPFYWLFGGAYAGLKVESLVAGAVALWALWRLARRDEAVPAWAAAAAVWLFGLYPVFRIYTHWVLSDMSYVAVTLVALAAFARAREDDGDRPWGWWLAASLLAVLAFYVRTAGVALLGAAGLVALIARHWRRAGVLTALVLVFVLPWFWWSSRRPPETGGYLEQVSIENRLDPTSERIEPQGYVERARLNLDTYARTDFPQLFWPLRRLPAEGPPMRPPPIVRVFSLLIGGILLAFGIVDAVRKRGPTVWDVYGLATLAILAVWAWTGDRFFLTIAPLLYLYILIGADRVSSLLTRSTRLAKGAFVLIVAVMAIGSLREIPSQWRFTRAWLDGDWLAGYQPFWQDYFEVADWIGRDAPDAIILARKPTFAWYFSGARPSFVYPFHGDPDATWRTIRAKGATHIIIEPMTRDFLARALAPHIDELEVVHAGPNRIALAVRIAPAPAPAPAAGAP
jgi:4-amino-4-deoxy-L-arabinose transferase-like glycosyltransferase